MSRLVSGFSNLSRVASGVSAKSMQRQISARAPLDVEKLGDGEVFITMGAQRMHVQAGSACLPFGEAVHLVCAASCKQGVLEANPHSLAN